MIPTRDRALLGFPRGLDAWAGGFFTVAFATFFGLVYGGASWLSGFVPWRFRVDLPFEADLPFVPVAAGLYLALNLLFALTPFVLRRWTEIWPVFAMLVVETAIAGFFFLLFPVESGFPERSAQGLGGVLFGIADGLNLERNEVPSLHVAFVVTLGLALAGRMGGLGRAILTLSAVAIVSSTVLLHEHHLVDVAAGALLAVLAMRWIGRWAVRPEVLERVEVDLLCGRDAFAFARRHPRYGIIALALVQASLGRWRSRRVLRTGFCLLQRVDDLLDGDRPCEEEPLERVERLVLAIEADRFDRSELHRLGRAFADDLRGKAGEEGLADAVALIRTMQRDRKRVLEGASWSGEELRRHHRRTFSLSVDLMMMAAGAELRSQDVPELIDAFGWCSVMRDLREDLEAGLVNVPAEVLARARGEGVSEIDYRALIATEAVSDWFAGELEQAREWLRLTENRLRELDRRSGSRILRRFTRSIQQFAARRLIRL